MPKVAIITTTYCHQKFIGATIDSVQSQDFTDWELLIGDDSPDNATWKCIQGYVQTDTRIRSWHHKPNLGIVENMNFLLDRVSDSVEYIVFLEGDDCILPTYITKKLALFSEYGNVALIYNNLDFIDENGKVFYKNFLRKAPFLLHNTILSKKDFFKYDTWYGSYSSLMIRRDILTKEKILNLTNEKKFSVSDWDLFFRITTKYPCIGMQESLTHYRRHSQNLSGNILALLSDLEKQVDFYIKIGEIEKHTADMKYTLIFLGKSVAHLENGERRKCLHYWRKSFSLLFFQNFHHKIGILVFLFFPTSAFRFILYRIIRRR